MPRGLHALVVGQIVVFAVLTGNSCLSPRRGPAVPPKASPTTPGELSKARPAPPEVRPQSQEEGRIGSAGGTLEHGGARVTIPAGALSGPVAVAIRRVGAESLPALPPGLINITEGGGGFQFLPAGQRFVRDVTVSLPVRDAGEGYWVALNARTFYWDSSKSRWEPLAVSHAPDRRHLHSSTRHFTLMVNAIVQAPEHPGPANFNDNAITSIGAGDPAANVDLVAPPEANSRGDANVTFPVRLPRGRGTHTPELALTYSSSAGNGPVGVGWDLPVSRISIDVRLGVPKYEDDERFLLDGVPLVAVDTRPTTHCLRRRGMDSDNLFRVIAEFAARVHRYQRVALCERRTSSNSQASELYWEVIEPDGTRRYYGVDAAYRIESPDTSARHAAVWLLQEVEDPNLNVASYSYQIDNHTPYLESVRYSSHLAVQNTGRVEDIPAAYKVNLVWDCVNRPDKTSSARFGFVTEANCRLDAINVLLTPPSEPERPIRSYHLGYEQSQWDGRTLLSSVRVVGAAGDPFHEHKFTYSGPEYSSARPTSSPPCTMVGAFCTSQTWTLEAGVRTSPVTSMTWPLNFTDEENYQLTQSGGFSFKWGFGDGANAGCTIGGSTGLSLELPQPMLRLLDINGDGVADRVWDHGNGGLRAALGGVGLWTDDRPSIVGISTLESEGALGGSQSGDARCGIGALTATGSMAFSLRMAATSAMLADADGDGRLDLMAGDQYFRGVPALCRNGQPPDQSANPSDPIWTCSADGLPACRDASTLCFAPGALTSAYAPQNDSIQSFSLAAPSGPSTLPVQAATVQRPSRARASDELTKRLALESTPAMAGDGSVPQLTKTTNATAAVGPQCTDLVAEDNWGPYTSARRRMASVVPENGHQLPGGFEPALTVLRWDAPHTGTVQLNARLRRPFCGGKDGVDVTLLRVTDFHTGVGTKTLRSIRMGPNDRSWKLIAQDFSIDVNFGDSLLFVFDTLKDVPISEQGIAIDQIISDVRAQYSRVCPSGDACRALSATDAATHRSATGQLSYQERNFSGLSRVNGHEPRCARSEYPASPRQLFTAKLSRRVRHAVTGRTSRERH